VDGDWGVRFVWAVDKRKAGEPASTGGKGETVQRQRRRLGLAGGGGGGGARVSGRMGHMTKEGEGYRGRLESGNKKRQTATSWGQVCHPPGKKHRKQGWAKRGSRTPTKRPRPAQRK